MCNGVHKIFGPVEAICHKSWGATGLRPPLSLLQSSFLPLPLADSSRGLGSACSPAANTLMQFTQSNSLAL